MKDTNRLPSAQARDAGRVRSPLRRRILLWIPAVAFASMAGSAFSAAFRFLRPRAGEVGVGGDADGNWFAVAKVSELTSAEPLRREALVEHRAGWSATLRGHALYVMPGQEGRVVSAVCPHEGCEVEWNTEQRKFLCPCHDSAFSAEGARLSGPAQTDLARLPTRVNGDTLEIQFGDAALPGAAPTDAPFKG